MISEYQKEEPLFLNSAIVRDAIDKSYFRNRPLVTQGINVEGTYLMAACSFSHRTVSTETRSSQRASTVDPSNRGSYRH